MSPVAEAPAPTLAADKLRRRFKETARKAAGVDDLAPSVLAKLPDAALEELAELWNRILTGKLPVPSQTASVRVALLDKEGGGSRPLSIASAVWRTVGTCVLRELRPNV